MKSTTLSIAIKDRLFPEFPNTYGKTIPEFTIRQNPPELDEVGMKLAGF